jgi:hypothetical protein
MNLRDFGTAGLLSGLFGHFPALRPTRAKAVTAGLLASTLLASQMAFAATTTVNILLDTDNSTGSGCTVTTANGPFPGVEKILETVVVTDTAGYRIQSVGVRPCVGTTFGALQLLESANTPLARGNGANGTTAVETYIPNYLLPGTGRPIRVGVTTQGADGLTGTDALTATTAGQAIVVDGPLTPAIPTLAVFSLALTVLLVALSLWYARRRGWAGMQLVVVCVVALSLSGQLIAAIIRDGAVLDWTGIAPAAVDPAGDALVGVDVTNFYSSLERENLFFRVDIDLNSPPAANAQSVVAVANVALPITLTGSDYENSPLTFTIVSPPAHGALTGTPPNVTYTATSGYGGADSFTFRVNDGTLDSAVATVSIDVKLPPTITSVNNATFIPGQANSFNFTATAVPSATFTLNACAPALPPSITVTNNGNNTATLAGNPTVAQGGTYLCTLTASNGFGSNATQSFTLNLGLPPTFTSAANTTFTVGTAGSFTVNTTATPATTGITQAGTLPTGVSFAYNGPGTPLTGTLSGTPAAGTGGVYPFTFTAANGIPPNTVQNFTLTVNQAPAITSAATTACTVGLPCTFTVTTSGFPAPTIAAGGVALPGGMTFVDNGNGTGTLAGTPATGTVGASPYAITFTATNVVSSTAPQAFSLIINKANTTTTITNAAALAATPSVVGEPYAVNVAVAPVAPGVGTPTGTVLVSDGSATCTITLPATSCNLASQTVGAPKAITAVYSGDASFNTSSAAAGTTHTVNRASTTTTISNAAALGTATVVGQAYPVTWTVTVNAPGVLGAPLTGNVTVSDGSATCVAAVAAGTCNLTSTTAGAKSITAAYAGDGNYNGSTSAPATPHTVNPAATTTAITNAAALTTATVVGQAYPVTWTVSVNAPGALGAALTGNVTVSDGSATCVAAVAAGTCNLTSTTAGAKTITAAYAGDANYNASTSVSAPHTVNAAATTTAITNAAALATATVIGQAYPVNWTVTVNAPGALGAALTGNVTVSDGSATCVAAVAAGTCNLTSTTAGAKSITAAYAGDANYNTSTSVGVPHTVSPPATTTTISNAAALGTATVVGQAYPVTWTVTVNAPGVLGAPLTGNVTVSDGSATCVAAVAAGTCNLTSTTAGAKSITAAYAGDGNYNGSTSAPATPHTVNPAATTTAITNAAALTTATVVGQAYPVTWTVSVNAPGALGAALTGNVTVSDGSATCVAAVAAGTCNLTSTTAGAKTITAAYAGDANYNASTSVSAPHTVNAAATTTAITNAAALATATVIGQAYPVNWTVTVNAPGALGAALTGNVTVSDGSATCVAAVAAGTCNLTSTTAGAKTITAAYAGDANYNTSTSVGVPHTVGLPATTTTITNAASLSSTPSLVNVAYAVNWSVTVNPPGVLGAPLTGNVTVSDGSATCVAAVAAGTCNLTSTTAGAKALTATYAGDVNYVGSASSPATPHDVHSTPTIAVNVNNPFTIGVPGSLVTFTVTGFPTPTLALSGCSLPAGLTFTGGQISGTASVGATSVSGCVVTATNAAGSVPTAPFTVTVNQPPSITSVGPATFVTGVGSTYTITTSGTPAVNSITLSGCTLPAGLSFSYVSGTTATIGTTATAGGSVVCTVTASNGVLPNATQSLTVTANQPPTITSAASTSFTSTLPGTFTVTTTGFPSGAGITLSSSGTLPTGVTFVNNGNGTATLAGTPAAGTQGSYPLTFTATNGITPNGTQSFTLTVLNLAPQVIASPVETFDTVGNTQLEFRAAATLPVGIFASGNLVANFTDADGPNALTAVPVVNGATANGGTVTIATNGEFLFTPKAGDTAATDSFTYSITDGLTPVARTVTVNLKSRVWYVRNTAVAGGQGRSNDPFNTLAAAQTASLAGDYIFVYGGDLAATGQSAGITLKANQKLYGEAHGLPITNTINGVVNPVLVTANGANRPSITSAAAGSAGVLVDTAAAAMPGIEIRGLAVSGNTYGARINVPGTNSANVVVSNVNFGAASADGLSFSHTGTATASTLAVNTLSFNGGTTGLNVNRTAGTLSITDFANLSVNGNHPGTGIAVTGAIFDATPGGTFQTVSGGNLAIGVSGNGVGVAGMVLSNVSGDLSFTDLDIFSDNGVALSASGTAAYTGSAGFRIAVSAGVATLSATGGPAIDLNTVSMNLPFNTINTTGSTSRGVGLNTVLGTFSAGAGSSITTSNAAATAFQVASSNATISYAGTISTSAGRAVDLTSNTGSTIAFTGGIAASTGAITAFNATGGGTVTATQNNTSIVNTLTTTTGTALNVANTTIGAAGLTFRSINAGGVTGPSVGISLVNTGAAGGLTVVGNSAGTCGGTVVDKNTVATAPVTSDCTGGTIQNAATGIRLDSTANVSLTRMRITGTSAHNYGIYGTNVTGFTFNRSVIDGSIGATTAGQDAPMVFGQLTTSNGLLGNNFITDSTISGGIEHNIELYGQSGTSRLTVTRTVVKSNSVAGGADGIQMEMRGSANAIVLVENSQFDDNKSQAIQAAANETSVVHFTLQNSRWSKTTQGNEGVLFSNGASGQLFVDINNNLVPGTLTTGFGGTAIFVGQTPGNATAASSLHARIRNNVVTSPQSATNHSVIAYLTSTVGATAPGFVHVHDNTITQHSTGGTSRGLLVDTPDTNTSPSFHATVLNNTVSWTDPVNALNSLVVQARQSSTACMHISGNNATTAGLSNALRARQQNTAVANLFGSGASAAAVLAANHPAVTTEVLGTIGLTGVACTTPTAPTVP